MGTGFFYFSAKEPMDKSTANGFDLALLDKPETFTHRVPFGLDADGEPAFGFVIVGKDSAAYVAAENRVRAMAIRRQVAKGERIDIRTEAGSVQFVDVLRGNELDLAAAVVVGWFGINESGAPAAFDLATARKALAGRPTWRDKIIAALEVESNFLPS